MKKRWAGKMRKADENVCLRSIENFKKGEVSNKVKCCRELRSNRDWKNAYQIEWYVGGSSLSCFGAAVKVKARLEWVES